MVYRGYSELNDKDFFEIESVDVNTLKFIDRINLYFKLGNVSSGVFIDFTPEEKVFVKKIAAAETFEDVVSIVKELVEHTEQQVELQLSSTAGDSIEGEMDQSESQENQSSQSNVSDSQNQTSAQSDCDNKEDAPKESTPSSSNNSGKQADFTSDTDKAWSKNQQQLCGLS